MSSGVRSPRDGLTQAVPDRARLRLRVCWDFESLEQLLQCEGAFVVLVGGRGGEKTASHAFDERDGPVRVGTREWTGGGVGGASGGAG